VEQAQKAAEVSGTERAGGRAAPGGGGSLGIGSLRSV
jgi:hypothetical protein